MTFPSINIIRRTAVLLSCLAALLSLNPAPVSLAAPQQMVLRGMNLKLMPLYIEKRTICVGQKERFAVLVVNDYASNVAGATVHAGKSTFTTGANGVARWAAIAETPGETTLTIYATKPGYTQSASFTTTLTVVECTWNLRMDYNEEFLDPNDTWVFQGSVEIEDSPFSALDDGSLSLLTGQSALVGQYRGSLYDLVRPFTCAPQPSLEGPYEIQFSGKYDDGTLWIKLSALAAALPSMVTIHCTAADPNYSISPFDYPTGQRLELVKQAQLSEFSCPGDGCVKRFSLSRVQLWPFDSANYASGLLIIERVKP